VKYSKFFIAHHISSGIRILNTKKVGFLKTVFSIFFKFLSFTAAKKTGVIDYPGWPVLSNGKNHKGVKGIF